MSLFGVIQTADYAAAAVPSEPEPPAAIIGYLTADSIELVPSLAGSVRMRAALEGELDLVPALDGDVTLSPKG